MAEIAINAKTKVEIDVTPSGGSRTWAPLYEGFSNLKETLNEVIFQASFFGNGGWGSSEVTGGQWAVALTGKRYLGDVAQDFIFSTDVKYNFGSSRKTNLRVTRENGVIIQLPITLAKIEDGGGDANAAGDVSVEIHGNGAPTIVADTDTDVSALALSTIVPAADATSIARGSSIVMTFNNAIDNYDGVFLVNSTSGTIVTCTKSLDATKKILTLTPAASLTASVRHGVVISSVKDIYGQSLANTLSYFTTGTSV